MAELTFNGVNSYATISPVLSSLRSATVSFSINPTDIGEILNKDGNNQPRVSIIAGPIFRVRDSGGTNHDSAIGGIAFGVMQDVVITYDSVGGTIVATVDTVEVINEAISSGAFDGMNFVMSRGGASGFVPGILKNLDILDGNGEHYFWAIDSGSTVSEESTIDANTMTFVNVLAGDWSGGPVLPLLSNPTLPVYNP